MATNKEENDKRIHPIDRFEIIRELGRGGTSIVYLVRSKESGRRYAMKTLKPDLSEAASADALGDAGGVAGTDASEDAGTEFGMIAAELLQAEAEILKELNKGQTDVAGNRKPGASGGRNPGASGGRNPGASDSAKSGSPDGGKHGAQRSAKPGTPGTAHPGIPAYYGEVYRGDSFAGFLMEYVEGESLQKLLSGGRVFSVSEAAEMGVRLCGILARLHEMEPPRIYRDLKPGNVLVKGDGSCVLVDYGAVRSYRKGASQDTHPLGTEGYAAPEQYGGWEQSDPRTDVYGIGAVLHHMLAGRAPVETGLRPLAEIRTGENAARVRQYYAMDKILLRACSIVPSMRYPSCRELGNALGKLCREQTELPVGRGLRLIFGKSVDRENAR